MGERESPQSIFSSASSSYVPGYDSSAPPLPTHTSEPGPHERFGYNHGWEENNNGAVPPYYQTPVQENDLGNGQWGYPYPQENQVLGLRLIDVIGGAFSSLWRASHTVLRLDLRRGIRWDGPKLRGKQRSGQFVTTQRSHGEPPRNNWETERASSKWVQGIQGGGARIKLTQIWDFPSKETGEPGLPWGLNVGFGANIEMDRGGHLVPKARLKTKYAALHVLPSPCFELRSKFPLGGTSLAVNVRYRIPLIDLEKIWESPGAHLMVNFYSQLGSGFHLTPGGLEFDEHVMKIGKYTTMRVAASILFPRRLPPEEGEQPIRIEIHRLGVKTRMM